METVQLNYIFHCIQGLKSGNSLQKVEEDYLRRKNMTFETLSKQLKSSPKSREAELSYELLALIDRGKRGYPVVKSLEKLAEKYRKALIRKAKRQSQQAPFLAFVPLFCFFFPALVLIFIGPLMKELFKIV